MKSFPYAILATIVVLVMFFISGNYEAHSLLPPVNAAEVSEFNVLNRGDVEITIDAEFDDWVINYPEGFIGPGIPVLIMGEDTWEPLDGNWDNPEDLTANLRILYDADNLYFALMVMDSEYVAEAGNPWSNDGIQMAINALTTEFPPAPDITDETHLYNFSIKDGWQKERGLFLGDAEIEMKRDEGAKQTLFEWRMPVEIFAEQGTKLEAGMKIAFAIIVNDSDQDAKGQTGWVGWGSHTIVYGKNPEEMKTLILAPGSITAVDVHDKLTTTWGVIKQ